MENIIVSGSKDKPVFLLRTANTSYMFRIDDFNHPEHIYYGIPVEEEDGQALSLKRTRAYGDSVYYEEDREDSVQDTVLLEWSGSGRGDYRPSPIEVSKSTGAAVDFTYEGYDTVSQEESLDGMPSAYGWSEELILHLKDDTARLRLDLHYQVYPDCDVIARRSVLVNESSEMITVHKLMSFSMDMLDPDLVMMTFNGGWAHEMHLCERKVEVGTFVSSSSEGFSSSRTNPGFILRNKNTNEDSGECLGFNLIWSGNHYSSVSRDDHDLVRVMQGVSPDRFHREMHAGESFGTPWEVMTYSDRGLNDLSSHFHDFVNNHIVRGSWKNKERPILVNDWEAFTFDFDEDRLVKLAEEGRRLGCELFVLDDGWFSRRNHDRAGLGDYWVNQDKLPHGISGLSERIHDMGMLFGLWFEPEAVNEDSDLFKKHPDWALQDGAYRTLYGRHELLLDLTKKEVRDYIVDSVSRIIDEGHVDYVKWDMNRQMTSGDGNDSYEYILGLYDCLTRIFGKRQNILLESCSSGGNRFDLGMMCFSPQIWGSDDTDAIERLDIQKGYSYLYPQSTVGAHVSAVPNGQTMRTTPLHTRFNAAAFGAFGYELDVSVLSPIEKEEIKNEISFYKKYRKLFQYGKFQRGITDSKHEQFSVTDEDKAITCTFRRSLSCASPYEKIRVKGMKPGRYTISARRALMAVPADGKIAKRAEKAGTSAGVYGNECAVWSEEEKMEAGSSALAAGIPLNNVFNGSGYNAHIRFPQDFGSEMYIIQKADKK